MSAGKGEKPLDPDSDEALLRAEVELIHEWTRVEKPVRDRIHLRWPRLGELLDQLVAAS